MLCVGKYVSPEPTHGSWGSEESVESVVQLDDAVYMHGKHSWHVSGDSSNDVVIEQTLSSNVVEYIRNRKPNQLRGVCFSFWYKPDSVQSDGEKNKARVEIDYYDGSWHTVNGPMAKPTQADKWCMAQVKVSLPITTTQVKVRIRGYPYSGQGFKANIDQASLCVYYYKTSTGTQGDVTLTTNIYYSKAIPHPEWDGFVSAAVGIAAKANTGYTVYKIKDMKVELLPNNGSKTTQAGRLVILDFQQGNNKGFKVDPRQYQELINSATGTGQLALTIVLGIADVIFSVATIGIPTRELLALSIAWAAEGGALSFLGLNAEKLHNPVAEGGASYKVWETLDYPIIDEDDRVDKADASYYLDWRFKTDAASEFKIRVTATVQWGIWDSMSGIVQGTVGSPTTATIDITVNV